MYVHELKAWPSLTWREQDLSVLLAEARSRLSTLATELDKLGFEVQDEATLRVLTEEVVRTSEIEGESLDPAQVRSSIARKLGLAQGGVNVAVYKEDHHIEGIVEIVLDATRKCDEPLTEKRLFAWHAALFPTGYSGLNKILVGEWRDDHDGPMEVVSGRYGNPKVHFEAPGYLQLPAEMASFFKWFEEAENIDSLIKAGVAHFYFVTLHPFADGNGRIARAIADLSLARADKMKQRYYSMSAQINIEKKVYYDTLEASQKATLDITQWLEWFLACLVRAIMGAEVVLADILEKARVWQSLAQFFINERQRQILNRLLDGVFFGVLSAAKYAKIAHCSQDTANRDLGQLVEYGALIRVGKGKATKYVLRESSDSGAATDRGDLLDDSGKEA